MDSPIFKLMSLRTAFDSAQQVDAPKCHPNTRKAVLDEIMSWVLQTAMRNQWIMWLNGAAGAGKSAIARSIVSLCLEEEHYNSQILLFPNRRNAKHPPICRRDARTTSSSSKYQDLMQSSVPRIDSDPLIFTKSLETQLPVSCLRTTETVAL